MANSEDFWRRLFGTLFLGAALLMLICGQTLLRNVLSGLPFVLYWVACFGLTALAMLTALLDFYITRKRTRAQHRDLIHNALSEFKSSHASAADKTANASHPSDHSP